MFGRPLDLDPIDLDGSTVFGVEVIDDGFGEFYVKTGQLSAFFVSDGLEDCVSYYERAGSNDIVPAVIGRACFGIFGIAVNEDLVLQTVFGCDRAESAVGGERDKSFVYLGDEGVIALLGADTVFLCGELEQIERRYLAYVTAVREVVSRHDRIHYADIGSTGIEVLQDIHLRREAEKFSAEEYAVVRAGVARRKGEHRAKREDEDSRSKYEFLFHRLHSLRL